MSKQYEATPLAFTSAQEPENMTSSLTRELARVEEANIAFYEAFHERDINAMAKLWSKSPHARCIHPGWELVVGWTDIRQSWVEIFRTVHEIEFELEDVHIEVAGRIAWANLIAHVTVTTDDGEVFQASVVTTNVFEQIDANWYVALHHSSNFSEEEEGEEGSQIELDTNHGSGNSNGSGSLN